VVCQAARLAGAEGVSVAAAANLVYVLEPLNAAFLKQNPNVQVTAEIGASGSLVAQIKNGAPYDVFLSADLDYPRKLVQAGGGDKASLVVFARGQLVLWTTRQGISLASVDSVVRNPAVQKLAIANPETAPYGRAATEVLSRLGLSGVAKPKLVFGENITQTAQFVSSGNADAGFVALSLVLSPKLKEKGRWLEVHGGLYPPLEQGAVLTERGSANPAARQYLRFLLGPEARKILSDFGYGLP
jgi:molybdate transport system substrate-binding protein